MTSTSFLIIQTASIGDVILSTALAEKLHVFYPDATIDFVVKKGMENLFSDHPFIHKVYSWDKSAGKYKNLYHLLKEIRTRKYEYVINVQRFASSGILTAFSAADHTIGFDKNPLSAFFTKKVKHVINQTQNIHEVARNQKLITHLTDDKPATPTLYPTDRNIQNVALLKTKPYICIAPASLWFTKQYPKEKWIEFIHHIQYDLNIYLLGSKSDQQLCEEIIDLSGRDNITDLSGKLNFLDSAALMKDAKMNFVNDSAPMHIASSVNAPVTVIFCSTVPEFGFGPLSADSVIVQTKEYLSCKPCGLHGYRECPEKHFKCGYLIEKEELLKRL